MLEGILALACLIVRKIATYDPKVLPGRVPARDIPVNAGLQIDLNDWLHYYGR